jgi:hypothetical protein
VSHVSEVIDLYLYDLEVSDDLFRKLVLDAIDRDLDQLHAVTLTGHPGYSVKA